MGQQVKASFIASDRIYGAPDANRAIQHPRPTVRGPAAQPKVDRRLHHIWTAESWLYAAAMSLLSSPISTSVKTSATSTAKGAHSRCAPSLPPFKTKNWTRMPGGASPFLPTLRKDFAKKRLATKSRCRKLCYIQSVNACTVSSMDSERLSQIIEIPDASLNEKLVPANDNRDPTALSVENFEAASILAPRDAAESSRSPLVITAAVCLVVLAVLILRLAI